LRDQLEEAWDWVLDHQGLVKTTVFGAALSGLIAWGLYSKLVDPPVEVGASLEAESRVVILLHGHGASKTDLEPLAEQLSAAAPRVSFILPQAPHSIGGGFTWYPSFSAPSQEAVAGILLQFRAQARAVVVEQINVAREEGVPDDEIYVGGFSQGATLALDVFLNEPGMQDLGGVVSMSGGALELEVESLVDVAPRRTFVSHGTTDRVLNATPSREIVEILEDGGHEVTYVEFEDGHTIPPEVVADLGAFLAD
jgi:phospholipase/carboxylesterase